MVYLLKKVLSRARYICWRINLSAGGLFERISFRKWIVFYVLDKRNSLLYTKFNKMYTRKQ